MVSDWAEVFVILACWGETLPSFRLNHSRFKDKGIEYLECR
jgi:hypothetical protein